MSEPVGSLAELKELLEGKEQYVFQNREFPFYSVLIYSRVKGLNHHLHEYVSGNAEGFNGLTGPNWLVAVLENVHAKDPGAFRPEDVYPIARFLGVRVDEIPALVFFTDPKARSDLFVLNLGWIMSDLEGPEGYHEEGINKIFTKIAAGIDEICALGGGQDRMADLQSFLNKEFIRPGSESTKEGGVMDVLRKTSATAKSVFDSIVAAINAYKTVWNILS